MIKETNMRVNNETLDQYCERTKLSEKRVLGKLLIGARS